jgi:hypothetical protein
MVPVGRLVIIRELVRRLIKYLVYQILNSIILNICYSCLIIFESNRVGESVRLGVMSDSVYNHVIYIYIYILIFIFYFFIYI